MREGNATESERAPPTGGWVGFGASLLLTFLAALLLAGAAVHMLRGPHVHTCESPEALASCIERG